MYGRAVRTRCINLGDEYDLRPCFMALTDGGFLVVNLHAPQPDDAPLADVLAMVDGACAALTQGHTVAHAIVLGDFNDQYAALAPGAELGRLGVRLYPPQMIKTCCFDPGYGMDDDRRYQFPGDYVLSSLRTRATHRVLPDGTRPAADAVAPLYPSVARSDHDPVVVALAAPA